MFEVTQNEKQAGSNRVGIAILAIVVFAAGGTIFYMVSHGVTPAAGPKAVAASAKGNADAVRDLKIQRATMEKDRSGTTAVWVVTLENKSRAYTYRDIKYETSYIGADSKIVAVNHGTVAISIAPGEQTNSEIRDVLYPAGTAWYKFRIDSATPTVE